MLLGALEEADVGSIIGGDRTIGSAQVNAYVFHQPIFPSITTPYFSTPEVPTTIGSII